MRLFKELLDVGHQEEEHHCPRIFTDTHFGTKDGSYVVHILHCLASGLWPRTMREVCSLHEGI